MAVLKITPKPKVLVDDNENVITDSDGNAIYVTDRGIILRVNGKILTKN